VLVAVGAVAAIEDVCWPRIGSPPELEVAWWITLLVAILIGTLVIEDVALAAAPGEQPETHPSPQWASELPLQFVSND